VQKKKARDMIEAQKKHIGHSFMMVLGGMLVISSLGLFPAWVQATEVPEVSSGLAADPTRPDTHAAVVEAPLTDDAPPVEFKDESLPPDPFVGKSYTLSFILVADERTYATLNGQRVSQGDAIEEGIEVKEITDDGVILASQGYEKRVGRTSCYSITQHEGQKRTITREPTCEQQLEPLVTAQSKITEIPLVRGASKTYELEVLLNGKEQVKFVLDTGASMVSIPAEIAQALMDKDAYQNLKEGTFTIADGSKKKNKVFRLGTIQVGKFVIEDVEASVADIYSPPLLGMSVLEKLGDWRIDFERNMLIIGKAQNNG
jgi:clan AA aspartic protease (TIGR02281 family)